MRWLIALIPTLVIGTMVAFIMLELVVSWNVLITHPRWPFSETQFPPEECRFGAN